MQKIDKKKLQNYFATAAALAAGTAAHGQYQYTDIVDTTFSDASFDIDLDGDTIVDFTIEHVLAGGQQGNVNALLIQPGDSLEGNLVMGAPTNNFHYVDRVLPGTVIDASQTFDGIGGNFSVGYLAFEVDGVAYPNSNWAGPKTDGYLGLRIVKNDTAHYGWLRMDVADSTKSVTIKDWSFNTTPDSNHVAGFELLSIAETVLRDLKVQHTHDQLTVSTGTPVGLEVTNAIGQIVAQSVTQKRHNIPTTSWKSGMYIVRIKGDNWFHNLKIWID